MRATVVKDINGPDGALAGAIEYRCRPNDPSGVIYGIAFRCPCGCGKQSWMPVNREHGWEFDGNLESPTLTPSILQEGLACKWHGYLTNGDFQPC